MEITKEMLAIWGACLSTLLALIKIWEIWSSRSRIEIGYNFTGSPDIGNEIIIRNLSGRPLIITFWELLFCERQGLTWTDYKNENPAEDTCDICIAAHSSKNLHFRGFYHFAWGHKALGGKRLYLRLHIAGKRKPLKILVYKG